MSKNGKYWPGLARQDRKRRLLKEFARILDGLRLAVDDILVNLPAPETVASFRSPKAAEDALDALVCGWVGIRYLAGSCRPFGDEAAAIWIPE